MKILAFSVLAALLVGLIFTIKADSKSVTGGFAMKKVEAASAEDQLDPSKSLFGEAAANETPTAEKTETVAKEEDDTSDGSEEGEIEDIADQEWEAPGGETPMSKSTQTEFAVCIEVIKAYHELQKKYGFTTPDAEVCALGDAENHGAICLGATRGQPCKSSDKGAEGSFQVKRATALEAWEHLGNKKEDYNPQRLEDNMTVAIRFLETMRRQHGENRFRAYNGGAKLVDGVPNYAKPGIVNTRTLAYDKWVRTHIPTYQAALEGKVDFSNAAITAAIAVNFSPPVPYGECWISSLFGEPRDHGPHQGMDVACVVGTKVFAIVDGLVAFAGEHTDSDKGRRAGIQVQLTHGNGTIGRLGGSRYFHLATVTVKTGDRVRAGQQIGTVGLTGVKRSGSHLHFESFTWGAGKKLLTCSVPGAWFPTIPFLPTAGDRYTGPKTPGAKAAATKFERLAKR